jgi:hypothetical protein
VLLLSCLRVGRTDNAAGARSRLQPVAEAAGGADECPTFQPSAAEFRAGSFLSYVASVEAQHPGLGMFKVKAPAGWSPSSMDSSSVDALRIEQPIRQNVRASVALLRVWALIPRGRGR